MCSQCDYRKILTHSGLAATANRLQVLEVIGNNHCPLNPGEIFDTLNRHHPINRGTIYRILDILVQKKVVERITGGGRSSYYGLASNEHHPAHPHFYCRDCGHMECLEAGSMQWDADRLQRTFAGLIEKVEIRLDGICKNCLKQHRRKE